MFIAAVTLMTGDLNMSMVTKEIESAEKKTAELVEILTKRMNNLHVRIRVQYFVVMLQNKCFGVICGHIDHCL